MKMTRVASPENILIHLSMFGQPDFCAMNFILLASKGLI